MRKFLLFSLSFSLLVSSSAHAWELSLLGVADMVTPSISANPAVFITNGTAFGGGAEAGIGTQPLTFHLGAFYVPKTFSYSAQGINVAVKETRLQVPLTIRYSLAILLFEAGGYLSYGIGNISLATTVAGSTSSIDQSYSATSLSALDYGVLAGAGARLPLSSTFGILGKLRYLYGLANASTGSGITWKYSDFQLYAGLDFTFGESKGGLGHH